MRTSVAHGGPSVNMSPTFTIENRNVMKQLAPVRFRFRARFGPVGTFGSRLSSPVVGTAVAAEAAARLIVAEATFDRDVSPWNREQTRTAASAARGRSDTGRSQKAGSTTALGELTQ